MSFDAMRRTLFGSAAARASADAHATPITTTAAATELTSVRDRVIGPPRPSGNENRDGDGPRGGLLLPCAARSAKLGLVRLHGQHLPLANGRRRVPRGARAGRTRA